MKNLTITCWLKDLINKQKAKKLANKQNAVVKSRDERLKEIGDNWGSLVNKKLQTLN